jgi:predicted Fe-Mo cluster-binding NifX family protein
MMRLGVPNWAGRVSPVFDVANCLTVVEADGGRELARRDVALTQADPMRRARAVAGAGVDVLICGAVSWPLERMLTAAGVQVIPQTCGLVDEVIGAFLADGLTEQAFRMPGCCGRRRRFRGGRAATGWAP